MAWNGSVTVAGAESQNYSENEFALCVRSVSMTEDRMVRVSHRTPFQASFLLGCSRPIDSFSCASLLTLSCSLAPTLRA